MITILDKQAFTMKTNLSFIIALLFGFICNAQTDNSDSEKFRIQISAVPAFAEYDFKGLNNFLKSKNLPSAKDGLQLIYAVKISDNTDNLFSAKGLFWNVLIGLQTSKNEANGHSLEQMVTFGEISLGHRFFQKDRHTIYAQLGFGGMMYNVDIHNNSNSGSFSGALDEYGGSVNIKSKNNKYLSLATGYDWALDNEKDILLGVHLGYRLALGKEKWEIKGNSYDDSPKSSAKGFFLGATITFR